LVAGLLDNLRETPRHPFDVIAVKHSGILGPAHRGQ
jgi:hypothetical protein